MVPLEFRLMVEDEPLALLCVVLTIMQIQQCPPQAKGKVYWEGVVWVEPTPT